MRSIKYSRMDDVPELDDLGPVIAAAAAIRKKQQQNAATAAAAAATEHSNKSLTHHKHSNDNKKPAIPLTSTTNIEHHAAFSGMTGGFLLQQQQKSSPHHQKQQQSKQQLTVIQVINHNHDVDDDDNDKAVENSISDTQSSSDTSHTSTLLNIIPSQTPSQPSPAAPSAAAPAATAPTTVSPTLLQSLRTKPALLQQMLRPEMQSAISELQRDPVSAIARHRDTIELSKFLEEFTEIFGSAMREDGKRMNDVNMMKTGDMLMNVVKCSNNNDQSYASVQIPSSVKANSKGNSKDDENTKINKDVVNISEVNKVTTTSNTTNNNDNDEFVEFNGRRVSKRRVQQWLHNPPINATLSHPLTSHMLNEIQQNGTVAFEKYRQSPQIAVLIQAGILQIPTTAS